MAGRRPTRGKVGRPAPMVNDPEVCGSPSAIPLPSPAPGSNSSSRPTVVVNPNYLNELLASEVPDWSEKTEKLLGKLTPLERHFVEWMSTGRTAADSYRLASRRLDYLDHTAADDAHAIKRRPHVRAALESAFKDRGFGARYDREFFLQRLGGLLDRYENSGNPRDLEKIPGIIELMAKLKGEFIIKKEVQIDNRVGGSDVYKVVSKIIAEACAGRPKPPAAPAAVADVPEGTGPTIVMVPQQAESAPVPPRPQ